MTSVVGTWRLGSWITVDGAGRVGQPMGATPTGLLILTEDGWFSAQGGAGDRRRGASEQQLEASDDELAAWARGYVAYAGRYEVDGEHIVFTGDVSLFPNWVGSRQMRTWMLDGDTL